MTDIRRGPELLICGCDHSELEHRFSTDGTRRTRCDHGSASGSCDCKTFAASYRTVIEYRTVVEPL